MQLFASSLPSACGDMPCAGKLGLLITPVRVCLCCVLCCAARYMYAEGMKLAKRYEDQEAQLADKLKVSEGCSRVACAAGATCTTRVVLWAWPA